MKEEVVVNSIERQLAAKNRYFNNLHGTMFSKNGSTIMEDTLVSKQRHLKKALTLINGVGRLRSC